MAAISPCKILLLGLDLWVVVMAAAVRVELERQQKEAAEGGPRAEPQQVVVVINPCNGVQCALKLDPDGSGAAGAAPPPTPQAPPAVPPGASAHQNVELATRRAPSAPTRVLYLW